MVRSKAPCVAGYEAREEGGGAVNGGRLAAASILSKLQAGEGCGTFVYDTVSYWCVLRGSPAHAFGLLEIETIIPPKSSEGWTTKNTESVEKADKV